MRESLAGTKIVAQICLVVNDVEKTGQEIANFFGFEKPVAKITDLYDKTKAEYRGKPTNARAKIIVFNVGPGLDLELLEPDYEPSTWREELDKNGEGLHHLGFRMEGMDKQIEILEKNDFPLIQKGLCGDGVKYYAYFDTISKLKFMVELLGK